MFALGIQSSDGADALICVLLARRRLDGIVLHIKAPHYLGNIVSIQQYEPLR
jgi:hypothetical protein